MIEIKHLVTNNRLPGSDLKLLCVILYFPLGLVLFFLRIILILSYMLLACILPDTSLYQKIINKLACLSFGISVTVENPKCKENVDIYVSNSLSIFDQLAMYSAVGSVSPGTKPQSVIRSKGLGIHYFGSQSNLENFKKNITHFISENKIPVHFTPEGKITNGKALIKFKSYPFQFSSKVQPVCIKIERPFLDITVTTLGSSNLSDIIFFMFSPFTNYKLKYLPSLEKKSLSETRFADIVRQNMAAELKVETPDIGASDVIEYEKRALAEQQRAVANQTNYRGVTISQELRRMTVQVKEVLPHVPYDTIYNDLKTTRSVDNTITNILEGRVHFIPERSPQPTQSSVSQPSTSNYNNAMNSSLDANKVMFNTSASSFAKSATERSKSFQERKEQLIATARRRYIEKHNLNIPF